MGENKNHNIKIQMKPVIKNRECKSQKQNIAETTSEPTMRICHRKPVRRKKNDNN